MAASTLVKDVLYRVSVQLHDLSPQFNRWTSRELASWLNDAQRAIAKYVPTSCSRLDVVKLVPGTLQSIDLIPSASVIPGDGLSPFNIAGNALQSINRNMGVNGSTPGKAIRITDRETMDVNDPNWHTVTGTAVSQYVFDPRTPKVFYVSPGVPSNTAVWVEISYLADPPNINVAGTYNWDGSDTTTISVDDKFEDDLVNYIMARAYLKDAEAAANAQQAMVAAEMFNNSINAQAAAVSGVNPNLRVLPFAPTAKA
jgi:hypothetical protein